MKAIAKFLENVLGILVYAIVFILFLGIANPTLSAREYIGYALILGFFAGMINNIERVLRELFDKKDGKEL